MAELEQLLVDLEREGWEALAAGRGGEYYREHLADDALMAFPFGVMSRAAAIEAWSRRRRGRRSRSRTRASSR